MREIRCAVRVYRRRGGAAVLAGASLALAIGLGTGAFSFVDGLMLRELPVRAPERLAGIAGYASIELPLRRRAAFDKWQADCGWWESVAAYNAPQVSVSRGGRAVWARAAETTAGFFGVLGAAPVQGRGFAAGEDVPGGDAVAVIGHGLYRGLFEVGSSALGATIRVNGVPFTVVGVMPPLFDFPERTELWVPTYFDAGRVPKSDGYLGAVVGRLKAGLKFERASAMARVLLERDFPAEAEGVTGRMRLVPLRDELAGPARRASEALLGIVAVFVLVACGNLAQVLLSGWMGRRQEFLTRAALGATWHKILRQMAAEAAVISAPALALGLAIAQWAARFAAWAAPPALRAQEYSALDPAVAALAVGIAIAAVGVAAALGSVAVRARSPGRVARAGLLIAPSASAVVLVAGAFVMVRGFAGLYGTDLGFRPREAAGLTVSLLGTGHGSERGAEDYYEAALRKLRGLAGVDEAGAADNVPLMHGSVPVEKFRFSSGREMDAVVVSASPGYFGAIGARLAAGRDFLDGDGRGGEAVAIVNEEFARSAAGGRELVGRHLSSPWDSRRPLRVVGIVGTTRFGPAVEPMRELYVPMAQRTPAFATFVVRMRGGAGNSLERLTSAVAAVDPAVPVYDVRTFEDRVDEALRRPSFYTAVVAGLGGLAVLLAAVGVYGAVAQEGALRRREMAIRVALGSGPVGVWFRLAREALVPAGAGLCLGVLAARGLVSVARALISGAPALSGVEFAGAAAVVLLAAVSAAGFGGAGAARGDPMETLRAE